VQARKDEKPVFKDAAARKRFVGNYHRLAAGKLACKNHLTVPAVAICNYCGYGICRECTVVFGLKRYCKEDGEMALKRARVGKESDQRGMALTVAAVLSEINGSWSTIVGFLLIFLGLLGPAAQGSSIVATSVQPFTKYFGEVLLFPPGQTLTVGFVSFLAGLIDVASGYYLWRRSKPWAVISLLAAISGPLLISSYLEILALAGVFTFVILGIAIVKIAFIGYGWRRLK